MLGLQGIIAILSTLTVKIKVSSPILAQASAASHMLTKAQVESMGEELADKWDESGMTLSEKLHGVGVKLFR